MYLFLLIIGVCVPISYCEEHGSADVLDVYQSKQAPQKYKSRENDNFRDESESLYDFEEFSDFTKTINRQLITISETKNTPMRRETTKPTTRKSIPQDVIIRQYYVPRAQKPRARTENENNEYEISDLKPHMLNNYFLNYAEKLKDYNMEVIVLNRTVEYNDIILLKLTAKPGTEVENKPENKEEKEHDDDAEELEQEQEQEQEQAQYKPKTPLSDKYEDGPAEKKIVLIVHGLNALGFKSSTILSTTKGFEALLSLYAKYLNKYDIYLMPMANPDGVAKQAIDPFWSKNNSPQSACNGVAIDRNFDVSWNESGLNSCSPLYPGPEPFSELESRAVKKVLQLYEARLHAFFHVHSPTVDHQVKRGEAVLYPFGYKDVASEDNDRFLDLKGEIEEAVSEKFKHLKFQCDSIHNYYGGLVFGSSVDFAYSEYGIHHAYEMLIQTYNNSEHSMTSLKHIWKKVFDLVFRSLSNGNTKVV